MSDSLDEIEAILLCTLHSPDYERQDAGCVVIAEYLSETLGHDEDLIYDTLRELSGLALRYQIEAHRKRLRTTRLKIARWQAETLNWAARTEKTAEEKLEAALVDAGFIPD